MSCTDRPVRPKWRNDTRLRWISTGVLLIAAMGYVVSQLPGRGVDADALRRELAMPPSVQADNQSAERKPEVARPYEYLIDPREDPAGHERQARANLVGENLRQARAMLDAKSYDEAIRALNRVMLLQPDNAEAHTRMGLALIGRQQYPQAHAFLMHAIDLDPYQADAYFGIAIVQEAAGNLEGAIGGMRNFLHVTEDPDPGRLQVAQARSAIWEWEARLGRGAWGPTRGIPPGFTEAELKRDGRGVGIKIPKDKPASAKSLPYVIESAEPKQIFKR